MANSSEAVKEAIAMQAEAVEDVEAAEVEQKRGASSVSIDLLIDAVRKEREGLDKLEEFRPEGLASRTPTKPKSSNSSASVCMSSFGTSLAFVIVRPTPMVLGPVRCELTCTITSKLSVFLESKM